VTDTILGEEMKKKIFVSILVLSIILVFAGCSKAGNSLNDEGNYRAQGRIMNASMAYEVAPTTFRGASDMHDKIREEETFTEAANLINNERKLIKRANVTIRTENLDNADVSIKSLLQKYEAYTASTSVDENSRYYSLRVPAKYYDVFLSEMDGMGRLINRHESTEDVTLRYYDLEGRLETKKELLRTFQAYLGRANNIEEILAVEARIAELMYDIEGTGMQLRNLGNQVDYSTIDLYLLGPVTSTSISKLTLGERVKKMFSGFGGFLAGVVVVLIGIIIYGIPILIFAGIFFWLFFGRIGLAKKFWNMMKGKKKE